MKKIAFFSSEFAVNQDLHIYAGGLGVVASDLLKAAYYLNFPVVGVSIFWSHGYYDQEVYKNGGNRPAMKIVHRKRGYGCLKNTGLILDAKICGSDVKVRVLEIPGEQYEVPPIYLLDADIPENDHNPLAQEITRFLYQGNEDRRLAQKIILSKGVEALERLGHQVDIYHLNEGFCLSVGLELLRKELCQGLAPRQALQKVKEKTVFTTHTPERAGNETHNFNNMRRMGCFEGIPPEYADYLGYDEDETGRFNTTAALLKMARISNGVSKLHGTIAEKMWDWVEGVSPIISVTNGVDRRFWQLPEFSAAETAAEVAKSKLKYKRELLSHVARETGKHFSESIATLVWARRFAEYKRPTLLLSDEEWIIPLLKKNRLQIIFAGKPHPEDTNMIIVWNDLISKSGYLPNLAILSGYELELSRLLKAGCDIWLNTPRRPREACGTSWMSAAMNCAINLTCRDGGMLEGVIDKKSGFLFGIEYNEPVRVEHDKSDFEDLVLVLREAMDIYYTDKNRWHTIALAGKKKAEQEFSAERMLRDYFEKMYNY